MPFRPFAEPAPIHAASALRNAVRILVLGAGLAAAQDYGTASLPADLADPGTPVQGVLNKDPANASKALLFCEGPAADAEGNLFFVEQNSSRIFKVTPQGAGSLFAAGAPGTKGMEFDPQGRLTVCQKGGIAVYDKSGSRTVLPAFGPNVDFKDANDLTIGSDGTMYFTNWDGNEVFRRAPDGKTVRFTGFKISNGVEWIEEKKQVFVTQDGTDSVYRYDVGEDGGIKNPMRFAAVMEPDGLTMDEKGNLYVASWNDGKVQVFDSTGKSLGSITVKGDGAPNGNASNCVFGGPGNKILYITGDGGAFKVQLKVAGRKRPGTTGLLNRGHLTAERLGLAPALRGDAAFTLEGRKVDLRAPAALKLVTSRPSR